MRTFTSEELKAILDRHVKFLRGEPDGEQADLSYSDLSYSDLSGSNLSDSNLSYSNLRRSKSGSLCRMDFGGWSICIREDKTAIGCKTMDNSFWLRAEPKDVKSMDPEAKDWWELHGPAVKTTIEVVMKKAEQGEGEGLFGDQEKLARYSSCTHKRCECDEVMAKYYSFCPKCRESKSKEGFFEKELVLWDGETPLYCEHYEEYFFHESEIDDFIAEYDERSQADLRLLLCESVPVPYIDEDFYEELSNEDGEMVDIPQAVIEAMNNLNEVARKELSGSLWTPTDKRVDLYGGENR